MVAALADHPAAPGTPVNGCGVPGARRAIPDPLSGPAPSGPVDSAARAGHVHPHRHPPDTRRAAGNRSHPATDPGHPPQGIERRGPGATTARQPRPAGGTPPPDPPPSPAVDTRADRRLATRRPPPGCGGVDTATPGRIPHLRPGRLAVRTVVADRPTRAAPGRTLRPTLDRPRSGHRHHHHQPANHPRQPPPAHRPAEDQSRRTHRGPGRRDRGRTTRTSASPAAARPYRR